MLPQALGIPMLSRIVSISPAGSVFADFLFYFGKMNFRLFDARAGDVAGVKPQLPGIHVRKEILPHQAQQKEGTERNRQEEKQHRRAMPQAKNPASR